MRSFIFLCSQHQCATVRCLRRIHSLKKKKKKTPLTTMNIAWLNKQSGMLISLEAGKKQAKKKTNEQKKKKRRLACVSGERLNHALCPYSCVPRAFFFFPTSLHETCRNITLPLELTSLRAFELTI